VKKSGPLGGIFFDSHCNALRVLVTARTHECVDYVIMYIARWVSTFLGECR